MRSFIWGTDWYTDCDDVVAARIFSRFIKRGEIKLLGVCINTCLRNSYASLKGFFQAEGINDIPIGIDFNGERENERILYQQGLVDATAVVGNNNDAEVGVKLYRRLLATSEEKVDIVEVGFTQVLADLLKSIPDDISEKDGVELVKEKVNKVWMMAGKWDEDGGKEYNMYANSLTREGAEAVCRMCPVPITFLGYEIGHGVITGGKDVLKKDDLLYIAMRDHGSENGRHSWDPMLTLMAIIGDEEKAGYKTVRGFASVEKETGANHFTEDENGLHSYVIKKYENSYYENMINDIIK